MTGWPRSTPPVRRQGPGVQLGDLISGIDDQEIRTDQDVQAVIAAHQPGDVVRLAITRPPTSEPHTMTITLGELLVPGGGALMLAAETVDRILRLRGDGLPVLSLYLRYDLDNRRVFPSRVDEQLHEVRVLVKDPALAGMPGCRCAAT